jgi:hypothetical protein
MINQAGGPPRTKNTSYLVRINGQPVDRHLRGSNEIGWVPVFEHFALQMIELRKMRERKMAGRSVTGRTSRASLHPRTPKASPLDRSV